MLKTIDLNTQGCAATPGHRVSSTHPDHPHNARD
jgi:hypothetical protein